MLIKENDKLPLTQEGEFEMPATQCQVCRRRQTANNRSSSVVPVITIDAYRGRSSGRKYNFTLEGILTCHVDQHQWSIRLRDGVIDTTSPTLLMAESARLNPSVPRGIKQDIEEAERDHFSQSYKSGVVMCRRALQQGLELMPDAPQNTTLGPLLDWATNQVHPTKNPTQPLLSARVASLAEGIKDYGDGGAHRRETFNPGEVAMVVHVTVEVLNELFP
jgi:hypothetical protein